MKILDAVLSFLIVFGIIVIFALFNGVSIDDNKGLETKFKTGDKVYILSDSTRAIVETSWYFTSTKTVNDTKLMTLTDEKYDVMYTDKNGVVRRMKWLTPKILGKIY